MIIDVILDILKKSNVSAYKIVEEKVQGVELFYIKKDLEMNREKDVTKYSVTVFVDSEEDGKKFRGEASTQIHPTMNKDEITETLKTVVLAASFVRNQHFELPKGKKEELKKLPSKFSEMSLLEGAIKLKEAIYKGDIFEKGKINSSEIFLNKKITRIINSEGIDVSYESFYSEVECITQWIENQDVENYSCFRSRDLDEADLTNKVRDAIEITGKRDAALEMPKTGLTKVIIRDAEVREVVSYYVAKSNASVLYAQIPTYKIGEKVQGEDIKGDVLNITLIPEIPYDMDGIELENFELVKNGELLTYHGSSKYCCYMNLQPTGSFSKIKVGVGSKSIEDMRKEPYLEVHSFSGLQVDYTTGDFGGEIRLAICYDGEKTYPVTGGSIAGNIKELFNEIYLSKESQKQINFEGPLAVEIKGVNVSGK